MKKIIVILLLWCLLLGVFLFYSTSNRAQIATFLNTQKENLFSRKPTTESTKITEIMPTEASKVSEMTNDNIQSKVWIEWPKLVEGNPENENLSIYSCEKISFATSITQLLPYRDTPMNLGNGWYEKINKSNCKIEESIFFSDFFGGTEWSKWSWISFHIVKEFPEIPWVEWYFPTLVVQNFLSDSTMFDPKNILFSDEQMTILSAGDIYVIRNNSLWMKTIFATVNYSREEMYGKEWSEKYTKNWCFDYGGPSDESQCPTLEEWEEKRALWIKKILQGDAKLQKAVRAIKSFKVTK